MKYTFFFDFGLGMMKYQIKPKIDTFTLNRNCEKYFGWKRGIIIKWLFFWFHIYEKGD